MKILVTGAKGQLGQEVQRSFSRHHNVYGLSRNELDITDETQTAHVIDSIVPDVVIHTAAYTAVDKAEDESERAFLVNAQGSKNVARATKRIGAKMCHVSTDYIFDGRSTVPYSVNDEPNPQSIYGTSKLLAEQWVRESTNRHFIVRTSWVFGAHGGNFVKTMLRLGREGRPIKVVNDQFGSPTYTRDLATFLLELIESDKFGVYHASNSGACSWYDFAVEIFKQASMSVDVSPCSTREYPRPAARPKYSVLDCQAIVDNGMRPLQPWQNALQDFLAEY